MDYLTANRFIIAAQLSVAVACCLGCGGATAPDNSTPSVSPSGVSPNVESAENKPAPTDSENEDAVAEDAEPNVASVGNAATVDSGQVGEIDAPDDIDDGSADSDPVGESNDATATNSVANASRQTASGDHADSRPADTERFLLFAPNGMLLVELRLLIDGRPHTEALEKLTRKILDLADTNEDGQPTWREVSTSPRFIHGQFGNVPVNSAREADNLVKLYDTNENGRVDAAEVPRFLTRNAGGSQSFSLRSSNFYRDYNRLDSPIRRLIDEDEDGVISREEMTLAESRLRSRDSDDDELLYPGDFVPATSESMTDRRMMRRKNMPDAAMLIWSGTSWSSLLTSLDELYAQGNTLGVGDLSLAPRWFGQIDLNNDDELDESELQRLVDLKPHLTFEARFGQRSIDKKTQEPSKEQPRSPSDTRAKQDIRNDEVEEIPRLRLLDMSPELEEIAPVTVVGGNRISIEFDGVEIEFFTNDAAAESDFEPQAQSQLNALDANKNGYLEMEEIGEDNPTFPSFAAIDGDQDDKVYPSEIAAYLSQRQSAVRGQIRCRVAYNADALFSALDSNNDGRLTSREISSIADRLASLDSNQDGELSFDEIPGSMMMALARGNPQRGDALYSPPTSQYDAASADAPKWFLRMDSNSDGDISQREFIGDSEQFSALDHDRDGFINQAEARSLEHSGGDASGGS